MPIQIFELCIAVIQLEAKLGRQPTRAETWRYIGKSQSGFARLLEQAAYKYGFIKPYAYGARNDRFFTLTEYGAKVLADILSGSGEVLSIQNISCISRNAALIIAGVTYRVLNIRAYAKLTPPVFEGAPVYEANSGRSGEH